MYSNKNKDVPIELALENVCEKPRPDKRVAMIVVQKNEAAWELLAKIFKQKEK